MVPYVHSTYIYIVYASPGRTIIISQGSNNEPQPHNYDFNSMTTLGKPRWQHLYERTALDPRCDALIMALLTGEALLCWIIIEKVPYTEIDWQAYMEEVEFVLDGERDYLRIRGGTGPLVYPAGFVYLFVALRVLTHQGTDIRRAQYLLAGMYLVTQAAVLRVYHHCTRTAIRRQGPASTTASSASSHESTTPQLLQQAHTVWSWRVAMACLCCSKRLHSIFVLRLFNDGPTMMLLYLSMCCFVTPHLPSWKWSMGCFLFSLAVSVKMNVLLFAPGLLLLLLQVSQDLWQVAYRLALYCALPQILSGAPFLLTHPVSYLRKAFELDRVFFYQWTVNWKVRVGVVRFCVFVSFPLLVHN